jgi:DNA-binding response OmpR family regulator
LITFLLENEGYRVVSSSTSEEALQLAKENSYSAIILDLHLMEISGIEICRQIRNYDQQTPIIFYTASAYPKDREAGLAAGANKYLIKPQDFTNIAETIKRLVS